MTRSDLLRRLDESLLDGPGGESEAVLIYAANEIEQLSPHDPITSCLRALAEVLRNDRDATGLTVEQELRKALEFYADEENYNEEAAPVYTNLGPPLGWVGEEYEPQIVPDEGKLARQVLREAGQPDSLFGGELVSAQVQMLREIRDRGETDGTVLLPAGLVVSDGHDKPSLTAEGERLAAKGEDEAA